MLQTKQGDVPVANSNFSRFKNCTKRFSAIVFVFPVLDLIIEIVRVLSTRTIDILIGTNNYWHLNSPTHLQCLLYYFKDSLHIAVDTFAYYIIIQICKNTNRFVQFTFSTAPYFHNIQWKNLNNMYYPLSCKTAKLQRYPMHFQTMRQFLHE